MSAPRLLAWIAILSLAAPAAAVADEVTSDLVTTLDDRTPVYRRRSVTHRRTGAVRIDGALDEAAWAAAPEGRMDWQQRPVEGKATGDSLFRVLHDDDALYVGVDMLDPEPSAIIGLLYRPIGFRRVEQSDWIVAIVAPSASRDVAYAFAVNAAGVKLDYRLTRNGDPDESYNGIWDVAIARTPTGWRAEFRIPYSQMRVSNGAQPTWGFQLYRKWGRNLERDYWSPYPITYKQEIAAMGDLQLAGALDRGLSMELTPFAVAGTRLESVEAGNTLAKLAEPTYSLGLDAKAAIGGSLKLTASINPDFGQIEADPSEVNLTDRETFFTERRPLFVEDADLYDQSFGDGTFEQLFYSRRIGARPHFSQDGAYLDEPDVTTIYGAAKLSGTAPGGVRIGLLSALAAEETSRAQLDTGDVQTAVIEPLTSYNVAQLGRSFRGGSSDLRVIGTGVHRFLSGTGITGLHENAYSGALQYVHQFANNAWQITALGGGSRVEGSPDALLATQRASQRYFQRPDATHVEVDPEATALDGYLFGAKVARRAGTWQGGVGVDGRSPGFEANDLGFLLDSDYLVSSAFLTYEAQLEGTRVASFLARLNAATIHDFAPDVLQEVASLDLDVRLRNDWQVAGSAAYTHQLLDPKLLRGGPAMGGTDTVAAQMFLQTNPKRSRSLRLDGFAQAQPSADSWRAQLGLTLTWDILPNLELIVNPAYAVNRNDQQFVRAAQDALGETHYVLGRIRQQTMSARLRLNYTITPRMALQAYAEPFLSGGTYSRFKEPTDPRNRSYRARFTELAVLDDSGPLQLDRDGDGAADLTVRRPDFTVGSLVTNLVFRWELRPASQLFVIWSQARLGGTADGAIDRSDVGHVFTDHSAHVVLVKLSYWMNL